MLSFTYIYDTFAIPFRIEENPENYIYYVYHILP